MDMEKLSERVLRLMKGKDFRAMNAAEISRKLNLQLPKRSDLRDVLKDLKKAGKVKEVRGARFELVGISAKKVEKQVRGAKGDVDDRGESVRGKRGGKRGGGDVKGRSSGSGKQRGGGKSVQMLGTLKFLSSGDAWCYLDTSNEANLSTNFDMDKIDRVRVLGRDSGVALDGDFVLIKIERVGPPVWMKHRNRGKKGESVKEEASGRVVKVLERKNPNVIGIYRGRGRSFYVEPEAGYLPPSIKLKEKADARNGQMVALEVLEWEHPETSPIGRVTKVLGWPDDPGVDIISVIHKHGLQVEFPKDVLAEADAVGDEIPEEEITRREDWRKEMVVTIDPKDAKDHDDAVLVKRLDDGWELAVHIAFGGSSFTDAAREVV